MSAFHQELNYTTSLKVSRVDRRGINFLAHWHSEIELIHILGGGAEVHTGGRSFYAKPGSLVICDSNEIHYYDGRKDNTLMEFLIFDPSVISAHYVSRGFKTPYITPEKMKSSGLDLKWDDMTDTADRELKEHGPYFKEILTSVIRHFWYTMMREVIPNPASVPQSSGIVIKNDIPSRHILSYLEENYADSLTLHDAAKASGFSDCYFSRYFRSFTGMNFNRYLNYLRITHAADMLYAGGTKMTEIASSCGFSNTRTFNRVFKGCTGMSPTEYLVSSHDGVIG